jgi:hypothetical protein
MREASPTPKDARIEQMIAALSGDDVERGIGMVVADIRHKQWGARLNREELKALHAMAALLLRFTERSMEIDRATMSTRQLRLVHNN